MPRSSLRTSGHVLLAIGAGILLSAALAACGRADGQPRTTPLPSTPVVVNAETFRPLSEMTPVRGFFVDNVLGYVGATVAAAESPDGAVYPVGSVVQLVPQEAMVKREAGFSPETNDWEFFFLDVDSSGTTIATRGARETVNRFGGNCFDCHAMAEPQWDLICESDHGCDPLPIDRAVIETIQQSDPR